jgi:hypothetical protein
MADDRFKPLPLAGPQNHAGAYVGAGTRGSPGAARAPAPRRYPLANPQPDGGASGLGIVRAGLERTGVLDAAVQRGTAPAQGRLPGARSPAILQPGSFRVDSEVGRGSPASPAAAGQPTAMPPVTVRANGNGALPRQAGSPHVVRPDFSGVNNGNARSIAGRDLGYGRQIDGVQVFSDGSGSGGIPRTMTTAQIDNLAKGDRITEVPSSAFTRPAPGVALSMATGGQTPVLGAIRRPDTGTVFGRQPVSPVRAAQLDAQHDMADIASGNMQSAQGRAAANLKRRADSGDQAAAAQLQAMMMATGAGVPIAGQVQQTAMQEQGATQRAGIASATDLQREQMAGTNALEQARIQRPPVQQTQIPMADGTLGLLGPDGIVRPATMADGTPARPARPSQPVNQNALQRMTSDIMGRLVPVDATGNPYQLGADGKPRPLSGEEVAAYQRAATEMAMEALGAGTSSGGSGQPPQEALAALRADPTLRDAFDQKYGAGAAARYL